MASQYPLEINKHHAKGILKTKADMSYLQKIRRQSIFIGHLSKTQTNQLT